MLQRRWTRWSQRSLQRRRVRSRWGLSNVRESHSSPDCAQNVSCTTCQTPALYATPYIRSVASHSYFYSSSQFSETVMKIFVVFLKYKWQLFYNLIESDGTNEINRENMPDLNKPLCIKTFYNTMFR